MFPASTLSRPCCTARFRQGIEFPCAGRESWLHKPLSQTRGKSRKVKGCPAGGCDGSVVRETGMLELWPSPPACSAPAKAVRVCLRSGNYPSTGCFLGQCTTATGAPKAGGRRAFEKDGLAIKPLLRALEPAFLSGRIPPHRPRAACILPVAAATKPPVCPCDLVPIKQLP